MNALAGGNASDDVRRVKWTALLPYNVQNMLKIVCNDNLDEVAVLADQLLEGNRQTYSVSATDFRSRSNSNKILEDAIANVQGEVSDLRLMVTALATSVNQAHASGRPQQRGNGSRKSSKARSPSQSKVCRFHRKFGAQAQRCLLPCEFQPNNLN